MMKNRLFITFLTLFWVINVSGQTVTLEQCYEAVRQNYPMIRQYDLIERTKEYNLKNAVSARYPQLGLSAKATYQSDVTSVPMPGAVVMPKDQYQFVAELNQTIWDGGIVGAQKRAIETGAKVEKQKLGVDLYAIRERVNNLYFGILMFDEQLKINDLLSAELDRNLGKVKSYVSGGIANQADVDAVSVEIITNRQNRAAIEAAREAYANMLSQMVGYKVEKLERPKLPDTGSWVTENGRPELALFEDQKNNIDIQKKMLDAQAMPKIGLFAQGAYGNPGLNMFKSGFTTYAIGGVRMSWNIGSLYTRKSDLGKIETAKAGVDNQRAAFEYNTNLMVAQTEGLISKVMKQMKEDDELIALRVNIKRAAEAKVEGGTMSVTDMLREVTAENSARQSKAMHEIEFLKALYEQEFNINPSYAEIVK